MDLQRSPVRDEELGNRSVPTSPLMQSLGNPQPASHREPVQGQRIEQTAIRMIRPIEAIDGSISFWVIRNNVYFNTNIKLLLNAISNIALFASLLLYWITRDHRYLYLSIGFDLVCQMTTWYFLYNYGPYFG